MVEGKTIVNVREMTDEELEHEGWEKRPSPTMALELDDGTVIYPAMGVEGDAQGCLFGYDPDAEQNFYFK
jgi:hypothetical protein